MFNLDQLRSRQEQRLTLVLDSWNQAKQNLEKAIELAETKEREYRDVSEDVRHRLAALDLVSSMARELTSGDVPPERSIKPPQSQPMLMAPENTNREIAVVAERPITPAPVRPAAPESPKLDSMPRRSSRPLFSSHTRSELARLSILQ
jgi:hypothetical protein